MQPPDRRDPAPTDDEETDPRGHWPPAVKSPVPPPAGLVPPAGAPPPANLQSTAGAAYPPGLAPHAGLPPALEEAATDASSWELASALVAAEPDATPYPAAPRLVPVTLRAIEELQPGERWQRVFSELWPAYRAWFLREGDEARASYAASVRMLRTHLPEIVPVYERLVELAGGSDLAARMLSMVQPPPYLAACSQAAWARDGDPLLVRNYDYLPDRLDGIIWSTAWTGRRVIGTGDSLWGLLDGLNDAGLAASLTFGGRRVIGRGFGIPLVIRYLLEVCSTVGEARAVLERVPIQLAHNVTLVDASGAVLTAYLAPDRPPVFRDVPLATNHQDVVDWPEYAAASRSLDREVVIEALLADPHTTAEHLVGAFLRPPLLDTAGAGHFGTLYTAVLHPRAGRVEYRWPAFTWHQSFASFDEGSHTELVAAERRRLPR